MSSENSQDRSQSDNPSETKSGAPADKRDNVHRDPVFYYSREHRLNRASPMVLSMNDEKSQRPGLVSRLFGTKANVLVFGTIAFVFAVIMLTNRFAGVDKSIKFGGNTLALAIVKEEGVSILEIKKTMPKSGETYIGAVDIAVSPVLSNVKGGEAGKGPPEFTGRVVFNPMDYETYKVSLPFEGSDFLVMFKTDTEQKSFRVKAKP